LIYRPPKLSTFISEFSEPKYYNVLVPGDFNIHVCCPSHSQAFEFLDLIDSFNLTQSMKEATYSKGHTLNLVLSSGFTLTSLKLLDRPVTDHKALTFEVPLHQSPSAER